jgi:hypothetical protein
VAGVQDEPSSPLLVLVVLQCLYYCIHFQQERRIVFYVWWAAMMQNWWNFPFLSIWVRIVPMPPSTVSVPVEAYTIRACVLSDWGYAMMGSVHNILFSNVNASKALPVALLSGSQVCAKSLMWSWKNCYVPQKTLFLPSSEGFWQFRQLSVKFAWLNAECVWILDSWPPCCGKNNCLDFHIPLEVNEFPLLLISFSSCELVYDRYIYLHGEVILS